MPVSAPGKRGAMVIPNTADSGFELFGPLKMKKSLYGDCGFPSADLNHGWS